MILALGRRPAGALAVGAVLIAAGLALPAAAHEAPEGSDPLTLVVSLESQTLSMFRGDRLAFTSPVSTGRKGYETPTGVFTILDKRRWHRSNIYSQAPMPFMQRLTWSGIALHAGHLPGYPASHGCIRLPNAKAQELFGMTGIGAHVAVVHGEAAPAPFSHARLFQPAPPAAIALFDEVERLPLGERAPLPRMRLAAVPAATMTDLRESLEMETDDTILGTAEARAAAAEVAAYRARPSAPVRIYITRRTGRERTADMQRLLAGLGHDPGDIDGLMGPVTGAAIRAFQEAAGITPTGAYSDELIDMLYHAAGVADPPEGHLYVRQGFRPLFDAPVRLRDRERPLGTHLLTVMDFDTGASEARWLVLSPTGDSPRTAARALDRIEMSAAVRNRIERLLTPGSSLLISDQGLGPETGARGTDFIVLTE